LELNLSAAISERLWLAIRATYEAGNYSGAILDSVNFLGDVIRDKSGLDSDGVALVGPAFSGTNPISKVNSLHTQSDQDEQRGVHFLLMGLYSAIRNPRSHGKRTDTAEVADPIIFFVDYLLGLIDKARSPFDAEQLMEKVIDPLFGPSEKYADLIVARIPKRKLLDVSVQVFRRRADVPEKNLGFFWDAAIKVLSDDEQADLWRVVSEELESAAEESDFISAIRLAKRHWEQVSEIARLRTEHLLIKSVCEGEYDEGKRKCTKGALGTWAAEIGTHMLLKKEYAQAITGRLLSHHPNARAYCFQYHFNVLREIRPDPGSRTLEKLNELLDAKDQSTYYALWFVRVGDGAVDQWVAALKAGYEACTSHFEISDDDIPF
jgi:uncharacterized protein (TIGR02391 family)